MLLSFVLLTMGKGQTSPLWDACFCMVVGARYHSRCTITAVSAADAGSECGVMSHHSCHALWYTRADRAMPANFHGIYLLHAGKRRIVRQASSMADTELSVCCSGIEVGIAGASTAVHPDGHEVPTRSLLFLKVPQSSLWPLTCCHTTSGVDLTVQQPSNAGSQHPQ